ncbi:MAG: sugar ABC transporter ATP-binding protein [Armatimonadetes bacterium]|nr:sugar ABC transporter ATP-binding protein [Armatimonadota bacterium]
MSDWPALEVRGITKSFPGVVALDRVSFDLRYGELHALCGENGAGKSTLIHLLAGVYPPDSGEILLDGRTVILPNPHAAAVAGIGVVFQERSLAPNLSVAENVFANRQPVRRGGRIDQPELHRRTAELLARFGLEVDPRLPVASLTAARQQMVEILKAVSLGSRVLILDEPTSSLATAEVEHLFANLRALRADGLSMIYVSHHLREVFELSDRITVLRDGRHQLTAPTGELTEDDLVRSMVGRAVTDLYGKPAAPPGEVVLAVEDAARPPDFAGVSFTLRHGEILGLAGLAGAGRTELARGLIGAEPLTAGRILLHGRPIAVRSPRQAIAHKLAYLTEDRKLQGLFLDQPLRDNLVAAALGRFSKAGLLDQPAITAYAENSRAELGIVTPSVAQRVVNLSGGNQQKVLLGLWLATEPEVLIADEPTRGVDVGARSEIYRQLRALAGRGVAILLISSDPPEVLGLSDRVLVMRAGRLVAEIPGAEATEERVVAAAAGMGERV